MRLFTGLIRPKVTVLGNELAGEVEAIGGGVTSFEVGDRVFGYNERPFSAHAKYMTIAEDGSIAIMPTNSTFEEAAPSTEGSHYALSFIKKAQIRSGQDVLVNGATGAIGSAAVQLVRSIGANVTAVCATENMALVRDLGADRDDGKSLVIPVRGWSLVIDTIYVALRGDRGAYRPDVRPSLLFRLFVVLRFPGLRKVYGFRVSVRDSGIPAPMDSGSRSSGRSG